MIDYELLRQKRKTISIIICADKVLVKAPLNMGVSKIECFINEKSTWIERKLRDYAALSSRLGQILSYDKFLYGGEVLTPLNSDRARISIKDGFLLIPDKYGGEFLRPLKAFYRRKAKEELGRRLKQLSECLGIVYADFNLTDAKSKWGSCGSDGRVRLNWRLLMLSFRIRDYVIVHELCHIKYMNHSKEFWAAVQSYLPDYKQRRKELKDFSLINGIFR